MPLQPKSAAVPNGVNMSAAFIAANKSVLDPNGTGCVNLSGGFHDAGDHVKFGLPQSYAASVLGWGMYEFPQAYQATGTWAHGLDEMTDVAVHDRAGGRHLPVRPGSQYPGLRKRAARLRAASVHHRRRELRLERERQRLGHSLSDRRVRDLHHRGQHLDHQQPGFTANPHITVYDNGTLIYGTQP